MDVVMNIVAGLFAFCIFGLPLLLSHIPHPPRMAIHVFSQGHF